MEESRMKKHVTVVGALHIGFGSLFLIGAVVVYFVFNFVKGVVGPDDIAQTIMSFLQYILPVFIGTIAVLGLVGGIGLLSYHSWARIIVIIVAALGCFNIPIGTLIGVYSIWVLMQDETIKLFNKEQQGQSMV
jgi:hypothetical protein